MKDGALVVASTKAPSHNTGTDASSSILLQNRAATESNKSDFLR